MPRILVLVLAAGKGTRMGSTLPKPLVPLAGRPLVGWLLEAVETAVAIVPGLEVEISIVVGHDAERVKAILGPRYGFVHQEPRLGTGHAVLQALPMFDHYDHVLVFVGDSAVIRAETVALLLERHLAGGADCTFLTAEFPEAYPYARVLRGPDGRILGCVESEEVSPRESAITEYFTSHYAFRSGPLIDLLPRLRPRGPKGEIQLTEIVGLMAGPGHTLDAIRVADYRELVGLNTPEELAWAEKVLQERSTTGA